MRKQISKSGQNSTSEFSARRHESNRGNGFAQRSGLDMSTIDEMIPSLGTNDGSTTESTTNPTVVEPPNANERSDADALFGDDSSDDEEDGQAAADKNFIATSENNAAVKKTYDTQAQAFDSDSDPDPGNDHSESDEGLRPKGVAPEDEGDELDQAIARLGRGATRRRAKVLSGEALVKDESKKKKKVQTFLRAMDAAAQEDRAAVTRGVLPTKKLGLLKKVTEIVSDVDLQSAWVDSDGLSAIFVWLKPLKKGSLPPLTLRRELYRLLGTLPVTEEKLRASQISKLVNFLKNHPKETDENKKVLGALMETWIRRVLRLSSDYRDLKRVHEDANADKRERARKRRKELKKRGLVERAATTTADASVEAKDVLGADLASVATRENKDTRLRAGYVPQGEFAFTKRPQAPEHVRELAARAVRKDVSSNRALVKRKLGTMRRADGSRK